MEPAQKNYYLFRTFSSTGFIVPTLFLFLEKVKGLSIGQILIISGAFSLLPFVLEVPLGYLGDRIGNKKIVILGTAFQILSCLFLIFLPSVISYQAYLVCIYIAGAALSGATTSLIRSNFSPEDNSGFKNYIMDINAKFYRNTIAFLMIGSLAYMMSPNLTLVLQSSSFLLAIIFLCKIKDKSRGNFSRMSVWGDTKLAFEFLFPNTPFLSLVAVSSLFSSVVLVNHKTIQKTLDNFLDIEQVFVLGIIYVVGNFVSYSGGKYFKNSIINNYSLKSQIYLLCGIMVVSFILMGTTLVPLVVVGYLGVCLFKAVHRPILLSELTNAITLKDRRATILSFVALLGALCSAVIHLVASTFFDDPVMGNIFLVAIIAPLVLLAIQYFERDVR